MILKQFLPVFIFLMLFASFSAADNISADDTNFTASAVSANGGDTISLDDDYHLHVSSINTSNIFIYGNGSTLEANGYGGIIRTNAGQNFRGVDSLVFTMGYSDAGGAIYSNGDLSEGISNSRFTLNSADTGGAVYIYHDFLGNITNSVFEYNYADSYGGAIAVAHDFRGTISNSTFLYNTVSGDSFGGGGLLATTLSGYISNSLFEGNNAYMGGAIYAENIDAIIKDTNFTGNMARNRGGAIYIYGISDLTLHSTGNMVFDDNYDSSGSNAIYYYGYGGYYDGRLNIITNENSTMEFNDAIADYGSGDNGKLFVDKNGNGTLIYNEAMSYRGSTNINEGTLLLNNYGSVAGVLNIADNAMLSINKYTYGTYLLGNNVNIDQGTLNINLNTPQYASFDFQNQTLKENFNGTLMLANTRYNTLQYGNYTLVLGGHSTANVHNSNSTLKNLLFNRGTLYLDNIDISNGPVLTVNDLNISGGGGSIEFDANSIRSNITIAADANLYDAVSVAYGPLYQMIKASVSGNRSALDIINVSSNGYQGKGNLSQNGSVVGETYFRAYGQAEDDGIYLGFSLSGINSFTNVLFDSSSSVNNILDIELSGQGGFTFAGNNTVYIGNRYSDYSGSTFITDNTSVIAIADNAFGHTSSLVLNNNTRFDLNSYTQAIDGNLNNSGIISINNGSLSVKGFTLNDGGIDLGSNGNLTFYDQGISLGDNSLSGNGTLNFYDSFTINGTNDNLYASIFIANSAVTLNHANSLGIFGNISLLQSDAGVVFDISGNNETLNKNIIGNGFLTKSGNGSLTLDGSNSYTGDTYIQEGVLISEADNFNGDINISLNANLIFDQHANHTFIHELSGDGSISQEGGYTIELLGETSGFTGSYMVKNGTLSLNPNNFAGDIDVAYISSVLFNQTTNSSFDGILSGDGNITQKGNYTLYLTSANSNFTGSYNISEGMLRVNSLNALSNASSINIERAAIYAINSTSAQTMYGSLLGSGILDVNLNSIDNFFLFADNSGDNFQGSMNLTNAAFILQQNLSKLSLLLNNNSMAFVNDSGSELHNLAFNGGTLDLNISDITIPPKVMLTVNELNVGGGGGSIIINANTSTLNTQAVSGLNLFDYANLSNAYQILNATNGVSGAGAQLNIINHASNHTAMNITQNSQTAGEAVFTTVAQVQNDGVYIGFGLHSLESFTNIVLNSTGASNTALGALLIGSGNFTFTGNQNMYIGNAASNYTGSTALTSDAHITALSDNAFGNTSALILENNTAFNLNSYIQTISGNLSNYGEIAINNGRLDIAGVTYNSGNLDLGQSYGYISFNGGSSVGNNSLSGYGEIFFNDDFDIVGSNANLQSYNVITNGTVTLSNADSLGTYSYTELSSANSSLAFDIEDNETFFGNIYGINGGQIIKQGAGTLRLDSYNYADSMSILNGTLILSPNNFDGNIDIADSANLIFENSYYSYFYHTLSGSGNITQTGDYILGIYSDNSNFTGNYNISNGTLEVNTLDAFKNAQSITVSQTASYNVYSYNNETLNNAMFGSGTLYINLGDEANIFTISNISQFQEGFNGVISLENARFNAYKNMSDISLIANHNSLITLQSSGSAFNNLIFNGGTLDLNMTNISLPFETMLTVNNLTIDGYGGRIIIDANLSSLDNSVPVVSNLYDYGQSNGSYMLINATQGVKGYGSQLELTDSNGNTITGVTSDINQSSDIVGRASFGAVATVENDGVYLGFGLQSIESFENKMVSLNSTSASNLVLSALLTGDGGFSFSGTNAALVGNGYNNYTGATLLQDGANITAMSSNAFGHTGALTLSSGTVFNLNSYYQSIYGNVINNGYLLLNGGGLDIAGYTFNNAVIDLGQQGYISFNNGISIGNNSLVGTGDIYFNGDFNISGANNNLNANVYINNGTTSIDNTASLGNNGSVYLYGTNSTLLISEDNNATFYKDIYGYGSLVKQGDGTLRLANTTYIGNANIEGGTLIVDAYDFYADVNISSSSNLIFDNSNGSVFYSRLFGHGNITQTGAHPFMIDSDSSLFKGIYNAHDTTLIIGENGTLGGDVVMNDSELFTYGNILGKINLNSSAWRLYRDYNISDLTLFNSAVYLGAYSDFSSVAPITLSIDNIEGNGTFFKRLNIERLGNTIVNSGDLIEVHNSSSGNHLFYFEDKSTGGIQLSGTEELLIIKQENSSGNYNAVYTGQIDLGAFTYTLQQSNASTNSNIILKANSCTNAACASVSFPTVNYFINYINTDTLLQRMGEVNINRNNQDDIWINTYMGQLGSFDGIFNVDNVGYYGFNVGMDRAYDNVLWGLTLGYADTDINYLSGSADTKNYDIGAYMVLRDDDFYINSVLKYQINKNSFDTVSSNGFSVDGKGDTKGVLFTMEVGNRYTISTTPFYIEPQMQVTFARQNAMNIESSNGLTTKTNSFISTRARLSAILGYKIKNSTNIYLKTGYIREFKNDLIYSFNGGELQQYEIDGNFWDNSIGITSSGKNHNLYLEGTYQLGNMFNNIKANLGYRYSF